MLPLHRLLSSWFQHMLKWPSVMYAVLRASERACMYDTIGAKQFVLFLLISRQV